MRSGTKACCEEEQRGEASSGIYTYKHSGAKGVKKSRTHVQLSFAGVIFLLAIVWQSLLWKIEEINGGRLIAPATRVSRPLPDYPPATPAPRTSNALSSSHHRRASGQQYKQPFSKMYQSRHLEVSFLCILAESGKTKIERAWKNYIQSNFGHGRLSGEERTCIYVLEYFLDCSAGVQEILRGTSSTIHL